MRTITLEPVNIYTFDELSDEAKENARSWYRNNLDCDYTNDFVEEQMTQELYETFLCLVDDFNLSFSLSNCQGDGVSFTATLPVYNEKTKPLYEKIFGDKMTKNIKRVLPFLEIKFVRNGRNYYCHKYTVDTETPYNSRYGGIGTSRVDSVADDIESIINDWRCSVCDELEKYGYEIIEYMNSDEYIDEEIICNEYEFTKDGKIWH